MPQYIIHILLRMLLGLLIVGVAGALSASIIAFNGPLYGRYGWGSIAIGLLLLGLLGLTIVTGQLVRSPRPHSTMYALYDIGDKGGVDESRSSEANLLWQALPILACILVLVASRILGR